MPAKKFDSDTKFNIALDWSMNQGRDIPKLCEKYDCSRSVIDDAVKKGSVYGYYKYKREHKSSKDIAKERYVSDASVSIILSIAEYLIGGYSLSNAKKQVF